MFAMNLHRHLPTLLQIPPQDSFFAGVATRPVLDLALSCQLTPPATADHTNQHIFRRRAAIYSMRRL